MHRVHNGRLSGKKFKFSAYGVSGGDWLKHLTRPLHLAPVVVHRGTVGMATISFRCIVVKYNA